jgi:hypothetical protein
MVLPIEFLEFTGRINHSGNKYGLYRCFCGVIKEILCTNINIGRTKSCGCLGRVGNVKHSYRPKGSSTPTYASWCAMKARCLNPNSTSYGRYGGRGIVIDPRWVDDFINFLNDMGERPSRLYSLDRIDVNGNYVKDNCRWILKSENTRRRFVDD